MESTGVPADDSSVTLPEHPAGLGPVRAATGSPDDAAQATLPSGVVPTPRTPVPSTPVPATPGGEIPAAARPSSTGKRRAEPAIGGSRARGPHRRGWQAVAALGRGAALGVVAVAAVAGSWSTVATLTGAPAIGQPATVATAPVPLSGAAQALGEVYGVPAWTPLVIRDRDTGQVLDPAALAAQADLEQARVQALEQQAQREVQEYLGTYGPDAVRSLPQVASACAPGKTLPATAPLGSHPLDDYNPRQVFGAEQITAAYCAGVEFVLAHGLHADLVRTPQARAADRDALAWTQNPGFGGIRETFTESMRLVWDTWMTEPDQVLPGSGYGTGYDNVRGLTGIDTLVSLADGTTLRVVDPGHAAPLIDTTARLAQTRMDRDPATEPGGVGEPRLLLDIEVRGQMLMTRNPSGNPGGGITGTNPAANPDGDLWAVPMVRHFTLGLVREGQRWLIDAGHGVWYTLDLKRARPIQVPIEESRS